MLFRSVNVNKDTLESIKDEYPEQYQKLCELTDPKNQNLADGLKVCDLFKGKLDTIALPKDLPVPEWLRKLIDYQEIITDNLGNFPVSSAGIGQFGAKKANYSNVVRI